MYLLSKFTVFLTIYLSITCFAQILEKQQKQAIEDVRLKFDMPIKNDIVGYLRALHQIIQFYNDNKNFVDMNFEFGIFLVNVNLKKVYLDKGRNLPKSIITYLNILLKKNDALIKFFKSMVKKDMDPTDDLNKQLITLFANETLWISQLKSFNTHIKPVRPVDYIKLESQYAEWETYRADVSDYEKGVPQPLQSDMCMVFLSRNPVFYHKPFTKCKVTDDCIYALVNGSNFGYALQHRLLLLIQAHYGRMCSLTSLENDKQLLNQFCELSHSEATYISMGNFGLIDLMCEQVCFCALVGRTEFLRRSWLSEILKFQTADGCFANTMHHIARVKPLSEFTQSEWKLDKQGDHSILGGRCNSHVTGVAAATLSLAIRYVLEAYY